MPKDKSESGIKNLLIEIRSALVPGLLSGVLVLIMSISLAALIFTGKLSGFIAEGIALAINTAVIAGLGITLFSRCKTVISMVDEDTAPVFALLVSFVVASLPVSASAAELYTTAIAAIVVTTLIAGLGLALLGVFRFGSFIQFLPHSVMGGYFSAVGWLLLVGGFAVTSGTGPGNLQEFLQLATPGELLRWLPAVGVAGWLLGMRHRLPQNLLLPGTVLIAAGLWYLALWRSNLSPGQAMGQGFLLGPFGQESARLLNPLAGLQFAQVDWPSVLSNSGSMASILLISVLSMILTISGLGYLTRIEPDMNLAF